MAKDFTYVLICEDDPFASDVMFMLLTRDFRTRVSGELSNRLELSAFDSLNSLRKSRIIHKNETNTNYYFSIDPSLPVELVLLDTEVPWDRELPLRMMEKFSTWNKPPKVLCMCTYPDEKMLRKLAGYSNFAGYIVKSDVLYSIASAVALAAQGYIVISPEVIPIFEEIVYSKYYSRTLTVNTKVDTDSAKNSKKNKQDIKRLNLIFNISFSDIENELGFNKLYIGQVISDEYTDLKFEDIILKKITLDEIFQNPYLNNQKIIDYFQKIIDLLPGTVERREKEAGISKPGTRKIRRKFANMGTLAFHLLTKAEIEKW